MSTNPAANEFEIETAPVSKREPLDRAHHEHIIYPVLLDGCGHEIVKAHVCCRCDCKAWLSGGRYSGSWNRFVDVYDSLCDPWHFLSRRHLTDRLFGWSSRF